MRNDAKNRKFPVASFLRHAMLQGRQSWNGLETMRAWHSCLRLSDSCWNRKKNRSTWNRCYFTGIHASFRWCMILSINSSLSWWLVHVSKEGGGPPNLRKMIADVTRKAGCPLVGNEGSWNHGYDAGWSFPTFRARCWKSTGFWKTSIRFPFIGPYLSRIFWGGTLGG